MVTYAEAVLRPLRREVISPMARAVRSMASPGCPPKRGMAGGRVATGTFSSMARPGLTPEETQSRRAFLRRSAQLEQSKLELGAGYVLSRQYTFQERHRLTLSEVT